LTAALFQQKSGYPNFRMNADAGNGTANICERLAEAYAEIKADPALSIKSHYVLLR
jgi:hypothetical protein